ncbi:MAG: environmental stress-induced protein Ves [Gammaproteobacteria bacterium]|jgi:environmental stress-induced protein Ves
MSELNLSYTLFSPEKFQRHLWRNGLGVTTELLRSDNDSGEFDWRLSIAQVAQDGLFSDFAGLRRQLLLLEGSGIELDFNQNQKMILNHRFEVADFDGGWSTAARLLDGPIQDFNVMTRKDVCHARVYSSHSDCDQWIPMEGKLFLVFSPDGPILITSSTTEPYTIPAGNLLKVENATGSKFQISAGTFIAIDIQFNG